MKKLKIFLICFSLVTFSNFAFAIVNTSQNINNQEEKNKQQEEIETNLNTISIKENKIGNFEFKNHEINLIKNFFNLDDANVYPLLNLIECEIKNFLTKKFDFKKEIKDYFINLSLREDFIVNSIYCPNVSGFFYLSFTTKKLNNLNNESALLVSISNPFMINFKKINFEKRKIVKI